MTELTTAKLLAELDISAARLSVLSSEGLHAYAKLGRNRWDADRAREWMHARRTVSATLPKSTDNPMATAGPLSERLLESRILLTTLQADGQRARNDILEAKTIVRDRVIEQLADSHGRIIAIVESWVRLGESAHDIAARKRLAEQLRTMIADELEHCARTWEAGEDVATTRVRIS